MRLNVKHAIIGLAAVALAVPAWARTYKTDWSPSTNLTIGNTQVNSGSYQLAADDSKQQISLMKSGKAFATVPGQWVKLPKKADSTTFVTDGSKVTQIQFSGSDEAFQPQ
jgi:hypothetical protein